jgi:hypothetical protein
MSKKQGTGHRIKGERRLPLKARRKLGKLAAKRALAAPRQPK